jgi:hypothetical protein
MFLLFKITSGNQQVGATEEFATTTIIPAMNFWQRNHQRRTSTAVWKNLIVSEKARVAAFEETWLYIELDRRFGCGEGKRSREA